LAEVLAQNWGNLAFGITEVEQRDGESVVLAYCSDLETNVHQEKTFVVKHVRETKKGSYKLTDSRDVYELLANQGARRLRACILGIIPGDIVDAAVEQCEKTLAGKSSEPIGDRARKMVAAFSELGVTKEMLEARLQHSMDAVTEPEIVGLQKIFRSIKDQFTKREDWFELKPAPRNGAETSAPAQAVEGVVVDPALSPLQQKIEAARARATAAPEPGSDG
jgi:hypothetical protein